MRNIIKILRYTGNFRRWYVFMAFSVVVTSLLSLVVPFLMGRIVDLIVASLGGGPAHPELVMRYLGFIIVTDIAVTAFTTYSSWIGDILSVKLQSYLTGEFYRHVLNLDVGFFDAQNTGNIVNKMYRGIESISDFVQNAVNNFLPFFLTAFVTIIILARFSPIIAVLLAALFPTYIIISHHSSRVWGEFEDRKNALSDTSQGRVFESFSGIRAVKAFMAEGAELLTYGKTRNRIEELTATQSKRWHRYDFYRRITLNVILFAILSYIIYNTYLRRYTIGEMTLLIQLVNQARFPLFAMSFILGQIQRADAGSKDFFDLIAAKPRIADRPGATALVLPETDSTARFIEYDRVSFRYETGHLVLRDMSFTVRRGEKIALVGESGQGKTTLVNLLLRYYEPTGGNIRIAGRNITDIIQESLRRQIAVVFQDALLFSGTILDNIRYGRPDASMEEVISAARAANAHEFVSQLPDGYDSVVGERGVKLSGGQKQRISIARAILKDAPIVILDEATSALDSRSEILVHQGLSRLMKGRTSFIIAHRLSTTSDANRIFVLSHGRVVQSGAPTDLLHDTDGLYAQMVHLQQGLMTASPEERLEALRKYDLVA